MVRAKHSTRSKRSSQLFPVLCLLLALIAAIGVAIYFGLQNNQLSDKLDALQQQLTDATDQLTEAQKQVTDLQGQVTDLKGQLAAKDDNTNTGTGTGTGTETGTGAESGSTDSQNPSYQQLYPDFYAPQAYGANKVRDKVIHLTFDDGPSDRTDEILDALKKENVKATFFVLHSSHTAAPDRLRRIVNEGHTLAFHTYSHQYKTIYASVEAYLEDAYKIFSEIKSATGMTPTLFRCPGGSRNSHNKETADAILAEMKRRGFVCHDWNMSVEDSGVNVNASADELVTFLMGQVGSKTRGVVLMHDAKSRTETAKAVPSLIAQLRAKGFTFDKLTPEDQPYQFSKK